MHCEPIDPVSKQGSKVEHFRWSLVWLFICTATGLAATVFRFGHIAPKAPVATCIEPEVRREWRTLQPAERLEYIDAVLCLTKTPSLLVKGASLYDDFTNVHIQIAPRVHGAAPFFPWHRLFLAIHERMLRQHCSYNKPLPYWDWTLDYDQLASSVIWDEKLGFGGDGNRSKISAYPLTPTEPLQSYCVTSGPFKHVQVMYGQGLDLPHCISRRFYHFEDLEPGRISGAHIAPAEMLALRHLKDYDELRNGTEIMLHNSIHWGVGGDFERWSSPNDPVFYLHHVQIDRIWWQWQRQRPQRSKEYHGIRETESTEIASLQDKLSFAGFWPDTAVESVMQTDDGLLCYQY